MITTTPGREFTIRNADTKVVWFTLDLPFYAARAKARRHARAEGDRYQVVDKRDGQTYPLEDAPTEPLASEDIETVRTPDWHRWCSCGALRARVEDGTTAHNAGCPEVPAR